MIKVFVILITSEVGTHNS